MAKTTKVTKAQTNEAFAVGTNKRTAEDHALALKNLEATKAVFEKQDNIKIVVPAIGQELGYEIVCAKSVAQAKLAQIKKGDSKKAGNLNAKILNFL